MKEENQDQEQEEKKEGESSEGAVWYEVEYSGGKSAQTLVGVCEEGVEEKLLNPEVPKFIQVKQVVYFSKITQKYELYPEWNSKWSDEILINTENIITIRKLNPESNILEMEEGFKGEFNAVSEKEVVSIALSSTVYDESKEAVFGKITALIKEKELKVMVSKEGLITSQSLLKDQEFMLSSFGEVIVRKEVKGDVIEEVLGEVNGFLEGLKEE